MTITPLNPTSTQRPDSLGRFGQFGGKYVPETLMPALLQLETAYKKYREDPTFQQELQQLLQDYVGRPSPLYFAQRCLLYTSPSPRDDVISRMPSSA